MPAECATPSGSNLVLRKKLAPLPHLLGQNTRNITKSAHILDKSRGAMGRKQYQRSEVVKDCQYEKFESICVKELKKLGLQSTDVALPLLGSRPLDPKSRHNYLCCLRRFVAFCMASGFYESLLPFYPYTPKGTVAAEEKAVVGFIFAVYVPVGEPVVDMNDNPLFNAKDEQLKGLGAWKDPEVLDNYRTAMVHVHGNCHGFDNRYWEACPHCVNNKNNGVFAPCNYHTFSQTVRSGNVMYATRVKDSIIHIRKNSIHVVRGASHLLPGDVRQIRKFVEAANDVYWMGIYTMLLMSIELFLRKMEYSSLTAENFNTKMFVLSGEYNIDALNIKVKGKRKRRKARQTESGTACWRNLYIWGDDDYPDIDLKRHLLGYLYCLGWKGGSLFPTKKEIEKPPKDGIYKTFMTEDELYDALKYVFKTVLKREDKLTTHTGRKSGYLWNRIRGADSKSLMTAAAHDIYEVAVRYAKDCDSLMEVNHVFADPAQRLGTFKSCYCAGEETSVRITAPGVQYQRPIEELVVGFMEEKVGISPSDPQCRHPRVVMEKLCQFTKVTSSMQTLQKHLEHISEDKTRDIMACVTTIRADAQTAGRLQAERAHRNRVQADFEKLVTRFTEHLRLRAENNDTCAILCTEFNKFIIGMPEMSGLAEATNTTTTITADHFVVPARDEKRRGTKTLPDRTGFPYWTAEKKLEYVLTNYDPDTGDYVNGDHQWLLRVAKIYKCFTGCCDRNVLAFLQKHGKKGRDGSTNFSVGQVKVCENCQIG